MGKIFCVMGKSATGKDTIFEKLLDKLDLKRIIPYTTRPIRDGEVSGREYHFCTEDDVTRLEAEGRIVELRTYHTVYGPWHYFTVDDGSIQLDKESYLLIGTVEAYTKMRDYFGSEKVVPIYVEVEDGLRLERALARERQQREPKYEELCRRFLADAADFSVDKLNEAGITQKYFNVDMDKCIETIVLDIKKNM